MQLAVAAAGCSSRHGAAGSRQLVGLLNSGKKVPDAAEVKKLVMLLNNRVGPYKNLRLK